MDGAEKCKPLLSNNRKLGHISPEPAFGSGPKARLERETARFAAGEKRAKECEDRLQMGGERRLAGAAKSPRDSGSSPKFALRPQKCDRDHDSAQETKDMARRSPAH